MEGTEQQTPRDSTSVDSRSEAQASVVKKLLKELRKRHCLPVLTFFVITAAALVATENDMRSFFSWKAGMTDALNALTVLPLLVILTFFLFYEVAPKEIIRRVRVNTPGDSKWLRERRLIYFSTALSAIGLLIIEISIHGPAAMSRFTPQHWSIPIALLIGAAGVWKYVDSRSRELKWKKTEFLFNEAKYIDTDKDILVAVKVLGGLGDLNSHDIFADGGKKLEKEKYFEGFEKLLNLLDRIAHAYFREEIFGDEELSKFGWYLDKIINDELIKTYCEENGFSDVIRLASNLR